MGRPKRNVLAAAAETTTPPDKLTITQSVARVVKAEGNSLYSCALPARGTAEQIVLVELQVKFRNAIWMKRGGYVLVDLAPPEGSKNSKVEGEIVNVVRDEKEWRKQPYWPDDFKKTPTYEDDDDEDSTVGKLPPSDSEDED